MTKLIHSHTTYIGRTKSGEGIVLLPRNNYELPLDFANMLLNSNKAGYHLYEEFDRKKHGRFISPATNKQQIEYENKRANKHIKMKFNQETKEYESIDTGDLVYLTINEEYSRCYCADDLRHKANQ